jgi:hypothetical protein
LKEPQRFLKPLLKTQTHQFSEKSRESPNNCLLGIRRQQGNQCNHFWTLLYDKLKFKQFKIKYWKFL